MSVIDRLRVIYELDDARFAAGINRMRTAGDRFARDAVGFGGRAESAFGGVSRSAIAAAASIAGLGVALNKVRSSTDSFKIIENQLRSIGQESDAAVDKLLSVAIRSRAPIEDLATAVARIQKATGDGYDETLRRVETLNKVLAVGGSTAAEVSSVVTQLSQALSGGVLQGDEFASLRESAPVEFLDALAEAAGATRGELKDLSAEGALTADIVIKALDSLKESADRNFGQTAQTIEQGFTNINSALTVFIGRVDEGTGASDTLVSALNDLSGWLVNNADEAVQLGQSLGAMFDVATDRIGEFLDLIDTVADSIRDGFGAEPLEGFGDGLERIMEFIAELNGIIEGSAAVAREVFLGIADSIAEGLSTAINTVIATVQGMVNAVLAGVRAAAGAIDTITAGAASLNSRLPQRVIDTLGLRTEGTNLAGSIQDVNLGTVGTGPRSSSGKPLGQVYDEASNAGAVRVLDALDRQNEAYGGALAGRQIASQTPLQLGLPPVTPPAIVPPGGGGGGSGSGGGAGRSGGKGRAEKAESPFFGDIEKDLLNLERQISLVGKSNEEVATAKARWELLDEAKKRGIPLNEELSAQIDAQAANVGRLTAELERGEKTQQQFDDAISGIADSMANALLAGESLREGLAQVFANIAADILNSGIRNAIASQFGGQGGGFNILSAVSGFFGGGDALTGALRGAGLPARARGGPVSAGQLYKVGEEGVEIFKPSTSGMIIPNSQIGTGGGSPMTFAPTTSITVQGDASQDTLDAMRRELDARDARMARQIPAIMENHQKRKG